MAAELCVVGGGKMGTALVAGVIGTGLDPSGIVVVETDPARRRALTDELPGVTISPEMVAAPSALVAVKPHLAVEVAAELDGRGVERVCSVAAGVTLAQLGEGRAAAMVRAMPNTPALVGAGVTAICGHDESALEWAEGLLATVGAVVRVPESAMDAVTGLSGSGPAYLFMVAEAMIEAGVLEGLPREMARELAAGTIRGAGELLVRGDSPAELRAGVTSPGGTTAVGLRELERHGVRAAFLEAVSAAAERSRRLGS